MIIYEPKGKALPYQPVNDKFGLTREALIIMQDNDIPVTILTKGGLALVKILTFFTKTLRMLFLSRLQPTIPKSL